MKVRILALERWVTIGLQSWRNLSIVVVFDLRHKISFLKHHFKNVYQSKDEVYQYNERVRSELVNLYNDYTFTISLSTKAHQDSTSEDLASVGPCFRVGSCSRDFDRSKICIIHF